MLERHLRHLQLEWLMSPSILSSVEPRHLLNPVNSDVLLASIRTRSNIFGLRFKYKKRSSTRDCFIDRAGKNETDILDVV